MINTYVGITEHGDAALDTSWFKNLYDPNCDFIVLITKNIPRMYEILHDNLCLLDIIKKKVIIHATITGHGGTALEPNVPSTIESFNYLMKLYSYPINLDPGKTVLRIEPIIPNEYGLKIVENVLLEGLCIPGKQPRVRFSFIDYYPHVKNRFNSSEECVYSINSYDNKFLVDPISMSSLILYDYTNVEKSLIDNTVELLNRFRDRYKFECCAEEINSDIVSTIGCVSRLDYEILGIPIPDNLFISHKHRTLCNCFDNKKELLPNFLCNHNCLYCYWK